MAEFPPPRRLSLRTGIIWSVLGNLGSLLAAYRALFVSTPAFDRVVCPRGHNFKASNPVLDTGINRAYGSSVLLSGVRQQKSSCDPAEISAARVEERSWDGNRVLL